MLAGALRHKFEELWKESSSPWDYLETLIATAAKSHPNYTRKEVFELLGLDEVRRTKTEYINKLEAKCPAFKALPS